MRRSRSSTTTGLGTTADELARSAQFTVGVGVGPDFGGCFVFCLVRRGLGVGCFHYIGGVGAGVSGAGWGLGDGGFVPGVGVCSDGGEGSGL